MTWLKKDQETNMKNLQSFEDFLNEANKMSMSYKLTRKDEHDVDHMWTELSKDKTKSRGDIIDEISNKLGINWFEISSWIKKNYEK